jgi:hypothetical protein
MKASSRGSINLAAASYLLIVASILSFTGQVLAQDDTLGSASSSTEPDMSSETYDSLVAQLNRSQQVLLNLETDSYRQAGNPMGCGVLYEGWVADPSGPNLEPLFIKGGVNYLFTNSGVPVIQLKAALADLSATDGGYRTSPETPEMIYAEIQSWSLAGSEYRNLNEPGALSASSVYQDTNLEGLQALSSAQQVEVFFARKGGGVDLNISLPLGDANKLGLQTCLLEAYSYQLNQ